MILINTVDSKYFTLDGVQLARIYQPLAQGSEAIGLYSIYDTRQQLVNSTKFDEFTIDGSTYASQELTIAAILDVIWSTISDSDFEELGSRVDNLEENQVTGVEVYATLAELPVMGTLLVSYKVTNDTPSSNNGYYHWDGAAYVKDATLANGIIEDSNVDPVSGGIVFTSLNDIIEDVEANASKIARELKFNEFVDSGLYQVNKLSGQVITFNQAGASTFVSERNDFAGMQLRINSPVGARAQVKAPFNITEGVYSVGFFYKIILGDKLPTVKQSAFTGLTGYVGGAAGSVIDVVGDWKFGRLEGLEYDVTAGDNPTGFLIDYDNDPGTLECEVLIALPIIVKSATLDFMFIDGSFDNIIDIISRIEAIETTLEIHLSDWVGKEMVTYGDSITAQNNGTFTAPFSLGQWGNIIADYLGMAKHYGRGVGGQKYTWNDLAFWLDSTNGQYVDRAQYDITGAEIAAEIDFATASLAQEITNAKLGTGNNNIIPIKGTFSSWLRIKNMIPSADRENIDLILIMGGTNDFNALVDAPSDGTASVDRPLWNVANTQDAEWIADGTYGNGGDFDASKMFGGMASIIMKFQAWCPNAVVVALTPSSGLENSGDPFNIELNGSGFSMQDIALHVQKIAQYMSIPSIDIYSLTGINQFNRTEFIPDGVHPSLPKGYKAVAKAAIKELKVIIPYLD